MGWLDNGRVSVQGTVALYGHLDGLSLVTT